MNLPSLPTGLNQIILVLVVAAAFFVYKNTYEEADRIRTEERNFMDTANTVKMVIDSLNLADKKNSIDRRIGGIVDQFNHHTPNKTSRIRKEKQDLVDSLSEVLNTVDIDLLYVTERLKHYREKIESFDFQIENEESLDGPVSIVLIELGIIFLVVLIFIAREEKVVIETKAFQRIELAQSIGYIRCQSCAKVFSSHLTHGKEEDGTYNRHFCIECYDEGKFTKPDLTEDQILKNLLNSSIGTWDSKFWRWVSSKLFNRRKKLSKFVHDMERWNNDPYKIPTLSNRHF